MAGIAEYKRNEDVRVALVFVVGFAVRFALQSTALPSLLADRIEVSTPLTSYKTCASM